MLPGEAPSLIHPVVLHERVFLLQYKDIPGAVHSRIFVLQVDVELIQPLKVELRRSLGPIDFKPEGVPSPLSNPGRFQNAQGPVLECKNGDGDVIDLDGHRPSAPRFLRASLNYSPAIGGYALDFPR